MPEITKPVAHRVNILEYERGWGSRIDEVKYFDNEPEARAFVVKFNSKNTASTAPDWYMIAEYRGQV